jgi:hypothetical protein
MEIAASERLRDRRGRYGKVVKVRGFKGFALTNEKGRPVARTALSDRV